MLARTRPSELTCGYCFPGWFEDAGLKSSTVAGRPVCARQAPPVRIIASNKLKYLNFILTAYLNYLTTVSSGICHYLAATLFDKEERGEFIEAAPPGLELMAGILGDI
jgi:hypothetical protein